MTVAPLVSGADFVGAVPDVGGDAFGELGGRRLGVNEDVVGPRQALALGEGIDAELAQV